ncbi:MAG: hypothetical protein M3Y42_17000 [Actinomycetota bacterium]|nr:hypothetical protein [Actinomycetota bacterium]MDQ2958647.1 hypothetical protein [Actinomycetota bacterium]
MSTSTLIGPVQRQCLINNSACDGAIIKVGSSSTIGTSPFTYGGTFYGTAPNQRVVTSVATTDPIGGLICQGGAFTNDSAGTQLLCNLKITAGPMCLHFDDDNLTTCGLYSAINANDGSAQVVQEGDSGGPVETTSGSTAAVARGEIVGGEGAVEIGHDNNLLYLPMRVVEGTFDVKTQLYGG